jgi:hypothetical protein
VLAALVSGCDEPSHVTSPADSGKAATVPAGSTDFVYPLDLGNRWNYDGRFEYWVIADRDPIENVRVLSTHTYELTQTEMLFGRSYVVEQRTIVEDTRPNDPVVNWVRYRQDASGLYEADVSLNDPPGGLVPPGIAVRKAAPAGTQPTFERVPASERGAWLAAWERLQTRRHMLHGLVGKEHAPSGLLENEITRLRYPPTVGKVFYIRPNVLRVKIEAYETLRLPAGDFEAARLRLTWLFPGTESDRIFMWIGECGMLKLEARFIDAATDTGGNVIGKLVAEEGQALTDLELVNGCPR